MKTYRPELILCHLFTDDIEEESKSAEVRISGEQEFVFLVGRRDTKQIRFVYCNPYLERGMIVYQVQNWRTPFSYGVFCIGSSSAEQ